MAIEKTIFSTGTAAEVGAWLSNNKEGYFDSVTTNGSTITCTLNSSTVLTISSFNPIQFSIFGETARPWVTAASSPGYVTRVTNAYKTSKGLLLSSDTDSFLFVTKNSAGILTFLLGACNLFGMSASNTTRALYAYIQGGSEQVLWSYNPSTTHLASRWYTNQIISMSPLPLNDGSYLPDVYVTSYTPYRDMTLSGGTIMSIGTTQFAYTGFLAIKE